MNFSDDEVDRDDTTRRPERSHSRRASDRLRRRAAAPGLHEATYAANPGFTASGPASASRRSSRATPRQSSRPEPPFSGSRRRSRVSFSHSPPPLRQSSASRPASGERAGESSPPERQSFRIRRSTRVSFSQPAQPGPSILRNRSSSRARQSRSPQPERSTNFFEDRCDSAQRTLRGSFPARKALKTRLRHGQGNVSELMEHLSRLDRYMTNVANGTLQNEDLLKQLPIAIGESMRLVKILDSSVSEASARSDEVSDQLDRAVRQLGGEKPDWSD